MPLPSIKDVAIAAGVSKATVSRVLNGNYTYIREETRLRVLKAISDLGYRPSIVARSLTYQRTNTVGLLISDVGNPYYPDVIHGVEDVAFQNNYQVFLGNTNYDMQRGMGLIQSFIDRRVDGVLIMSSSMSNNWLQKLIQNDIPAVVVDWDINGLSGKLGCIYVDFKPGLQSAAEYLVKIGHRRFAHISGPLFLQTSKIRQFYFIEALNNLGINPQDIICIQGNLNIDGGYIAMENIININNPPTAIFAANDLSALGAIKAARQYGLNVPNHISIIGLDDIWLANQNDPPLTTIALPKYEIGLKAMNILLELINIPSSESSILKVDHVESKLIIRKTTSSPPIFP